MKNAFTLLCLTLIMFTNGCAFGQLTQYPWTATIKVVGEDGNPVPGADVSVQYTILPPPSDPNQPTYGEVKGLTDDNGMFTASHTDSSWTFGITVTTVGYYPTHIGHELYQPGQFDDKTVTANRNPSFTLLLKKIGTPIPMYAKLIDSEPPVFKKTGRPPIAFTNTVGYDFMTGDWVAPYGKGVNADVFFTEEFNKKSPTDYSYKLSVSFPNKGDGIQGFTREWSQGVSGLLSLHEAPVDGYQPEYEQTQMQNLDRIYYFRVKTKIDDRGQIVSAHYGKIYGDFMQFRYYLNPTPNGRNVEFDPKQNLLGGLDSLERVAAP
jgi:hypothetical protein